MAAWSDNDGTLRFVPSICHRVALRLSFTTRLTRLVGEIVGDAGAKEGDQTREGTGIVLVVEPKRYGDGTE